MTELLNKPPSVTLLGHPIAGASWEGFMIETILNAVSPDTESHYYRTSAGAEIELLITPPGKPPIAIEIKRSLSPSVSKGFHLACNDVQTGSRFVLYPGEECYPINETVRVIGITELLNEVS